MRNTHGRRHSPVAASSVGAPRKKSTCAFGARRAVKDADGAAASARSSARTVSPIRSSRRTRIPRRGPARSAAGSDPASSFSVIAVAIDRGGEPPARREPGNVLAGFASEPANVLAAFESSSADRSSEIGRRRADQSRGTFWPHLPGASHRSRSPFRGARRSRLRCGGSSSRARRRARTCDFFGIFR